MESLISASMIRRIQTAALPEYSRIERCPKCWHTKLTYTHRPEHDGKLFVRYALQSGIRQVEAGDDPDHPAIHEAMIAQCCWCEYSWEERPLDFKVDRVN